MLALTALMTAAVRLRVVAAMTVFALVPSVTQRAIVSTAISSCLGCGEVFPRQNLTRGRCFSCNKIAMSDRSKAIAKANDRAMSEAARKFLSEIGNSSKGEAIRPQVLEGFHKVIGGALRFGETIAEEYQKSRGVNPQTGLDDPAYDWKPQIAAKFAEIMMRTASQQDDAQSFDPSNLSDDDLQGILQGLLIDNIRSNPAFCEAVLGVMMQERPELVHNAVNPPPVEAESVRKVDLSEIGLDEKDAGDVE